MGKYVTLMGTEQVQSAANVMRDAAHETNRAAGSMSDALRQHQMYLDEFLGRLELIMKGSSNDV